MGETVLVVGAGQAGAQAVASLRQEGFDGQIILIGDEPVLPYQRPLVKGVFGWKAAATSRISAAGRVLSASARRSHP